MLPSPALTAPKRSPLRPQPWPTLLAAVRGACVARCARALVVGGTGRVGGSTAAWLRRFGVDVTVAGRRRESYEAFKRRWTGGEAPEFLELDHRVAGLKMRLGARFQGVFMAWWHVQGAREHSQSAVLGLGSRATHGGAFPGCEGADDLETCLKSRAPAAGALRKQAVEMRVPYVDVCDDTELCRSAKRVESPVPAVVSAGIWPGVSGLMVREAHERLGGIQDTARDQPRGA